MAADRDTIEAVYDELEAALEKAASLTCDALTTPR
jgi:hypothetical protein